jgi:hypothetical protein
MLRCNILIIMPECLPAMPIKLSITIRIAANSSVRYDFNDEMDHDAAQGGERLMGLIEGLLLLVIACTIFGVIRKIRGGTFLPPPGSDGDHHVRDKDGRWWRINADDGAMEWKRYLAQNENDPPPIRMTSIRFRR